MKKIDEGLMREYLDREAKRGLTGPKWEKYRGARWFLCVRLPRAKTMSRQAERRGRGRQPQAQHRIEGTAPRFKITPPSIAAGPSSLAPNQL